MEQFLTDVWNIIIQTGKNIDQIGTVPVFTVITGIAGIIGFYIKRLFANIDFKNQQQIQHSGWLLQRTVSYAEKHYIHLIRCILNLKQDLDKADKTKNSQIIQDAYTSTVQFGKKYQEFEKSTGANFLFIERMNENMAIENFQSLFFSLPFDRNDIETISDSSTSRQFQSFENWIMSVNCTNSKKIALDSLRNLAKVLDLESEKILHYDEFLRTLREIKMTRRKRKFTGWISAIRKKIQKKNPDKFYIHYASSKYTAAGSDIVVFGKGFDKENDKKEKITYKLFMNNKELQKLKIDNDSIKVTIPANTPIGAYDITATFEYNNIEGNEPMGIVVHVIDQDSFDKRKLLPKPTINNDELKSPCIQEASKNLESEVF